MILGGPGTVSPAVEDQLRSLAGNVRRIAGANRFATSAEVSEQAFPGGAPVAYLATGTTAADALAAGPVAALAGGPVLLVRGNCIPPRVEAEIARLGNPGLVILGGDRAVGMAVEDETRCPTGGDQPGTPTVGAKPTTATWDDDGPDPHIARFGHQWYAYTTGTTWGNNIGVLVSDRPDGGWRTTTGQTWGSTALDTSTIPGWQVPDSQWAPAVYRYGGRYVMFYAAQVQSTREWCLSVAVAGAPEGPFRDQTGATGPIVCQDHLDGVIDPHPFVDADGRAWLHWKNNDGFPGNTYGVDAVSKVWAVRLSADGTRPVGGYQEVMAKDTVRLPVADDPRQPPDGAARRRPLPVPHRRRLRRQRHLRRRVRRVRRTARARARPRTGSSRATATWPVRAAAPWPGARTGAGGSATTPGRRVATTTAHPATGSASSSSRR